MTYFAQQGAYRIAYDALGAGHPPLVFVHGASSDRTVWRPIVSALPERCRKFALDRLGYGDSDKPELSYRMTTFAESIEAVLDQQNERRAVIVGHSNGVPVARQFFRLAPERVAALVLLDGALESGISAGHLAWMRSKLEGPDYSSMLRELVARMPVGQLATEQARELERAALAVPQHVMVGELDAMADDAAWTADPMDVPMLVIRAANSRPSATEAEFVKGLNPEARYEVWDDVSHFLVLEAPERVATRIWEFVDSVDLG